MLLDVDQTHNLLLDLNRFPCFKDSISRAKYLFPLYRYKWFFIILKAIFIKDSKISHDVLLEKCFRYLSFINKYLID